jgi:heme exporter protein A
VAAAVEVEGLSFSFGAVPVLRGLSFKVERGSVATIFGPNGAGKTTFLKLLAGLLRPSRGTVRVEGVDAGRAPADHRRLIGVISHQPYLYPQLTGLENLEFYGRMYGLKEPRTEARRLMEQMGLSAAMRLEVADYSRGMQQRLAVARALLHHPRVLLLDEPFTGLDYQAREKLAALIGSLRDGEKTVIMTTHDIDEGLGLSDRAAVLARGRIVLETTPQASEREAFLAAYREAVAGGPEAVAAGRAGEEPEA